MRFCCWVPSAGLSRLKVTRQWRGEVWPKEITQFWCLTTFLFNCKALALALGVWLHALLIPSSKLAGSNSNVCSWFLVLLY